MALRCKPGDLAIVEGNPSTTPELKNRYVIVDRIAIRGTDYEVCENIPNRPAWVCYSPGTMLPFRIRSGELRWGKERAIADFLLRPIRPDAEPESVTTTRELAEQ